MVDIEELRSLMALTRVTGLGLMGAHCLLQAAGSAAEIFRHPLALRDRIPAIQPRMLQALASSEPFARADCELDFALRNGIECLAIGDENYPSRLRECEDAPLVLYYRGTAPLNAQRVVSVVGTRHATTYGHDVCERFVRELSALCPGLQVLSGLAYGIDIDAHRASLAAGTDTVAVLAHGLDRIYPAMHKNVAAQMCSHGGLLTEFMSGTEPERYNFVRRNRIVAGMADAVVVIESASKGGALITASLAESYHRDCFAFPGRVNDEYSKGCNDLISDNRAALITSAADFVKAMNWDNAAFATRKEPVQRELFVELTDEERPLVDVLSRYPDGIQINSLLIECDIPINRLNALLFGLEMKGVVKIAAGGMYRMV